MREVLHGSIQQVLSNQPYALITWSHLLCDRLSTVFVRCDDSPVQKCSWYDKAAVTVGKMRGRETECWFCVIGVELLNSP